MTKAERLAKVHERACRHMDAIWQVVGPERDLSLSDRRFATVRGAQWEGGWITGEDQEAGTGIPRMEVNKVHKGLIRLYSDYRNNRFSVDFRPKDKGTADDTANALDGLYRADENDADGAAALDNGFDEAASGGFGAWRYRTTWEDDSDPDNEHQRIVKEPIYDADISVFFDLDAKKQDKSDARHAFVISTMSHDAFEREWPGHDPASFDHVGVYWADRYEWTTPDTIKIAEYYEVEEKSVLRVVYRNDILEEEKGLDEPSEEQIAELEQTGWYEVRRRKIKTKRVRKYIISGDEVLEDEGYIAGPNIPIVPVFGKRWFVNGVERFMGLTRLARDPQVIYNTAASSLQELASASPFERPIFYPEQVAGHEDTWARGNIDRAAYSLINPMLDNDGNPIVTGEIGKVVPPQVPPALAALIQLAGQDIADLTGEAEQVDEVPSNVSAKAIELVTNRVDDRNYIYFDNMRKAVKRDGEIWLGMASELYVEEGREMPTVDQYGAKSFVTLAEPRINASGKQYLANDLKSGRYDVIVDVGPSSKTRQDATVKALIGIANVASSSGDTETAMACTSVALINMDGEGLDDLQAWKRWQLVQQGIVKPNEEEKARLAQQAENAQPDPQAQLIGAATAQAAAEAQKAEAQTAKAVAETEKINAQTAEVIAGIEGDNQDRALEALRLSEESARRSEEANVPPA